jgi:sugar lactone lactonase YvrE
MTNARQGSFWHRAGPIAALAGLLAATFANEGCSGTGDTGSGGSGGTSSSSQSSSQSSTTGSTTSTTSSTGAGTGGMFGGKASAAADALLALDVTPDPGGVTLFFTAVDPTTADTGVYQAPADGSAMTPVAVKVGKPFAAPFGITISTDGKQLFVADPGATDAGSNKDLGVIFSLPVAGGTPTPLAGTELTSPHSVALVKESTADILYFTGLDKTDGSPGVFKIPAAGGTVSVVAKGAPFIDPSGLAVAADGTIYVADTVGAATRHATIIKVPKTGAPSPLFPDLRVGYPAGVALSKDDKTLFVSSLDPVKFTDQLLEIDVSNGSMVGTISMGVDTFTEAAGLHRAHDVDVFGWADSAAGSKGGTVFTVK